MIVLNHLKGKKRKLTKRLLRYTYRSTRK